MGKKVLRPLITQKAVAMFGKKSHPLEKMVVVLQCVRSVKSRTWGQEGFCSPPSLATGWKIPALISQRPFEPADC